MSSIPSQKSYKLEDLGNYITPNLNTPVDKKNSIEMQPAKRFLSNIKNIVLSTFHRIGHVFYRLIQGDFNIKRNYITNPDIVIILKNRVDQLKSEDIRSIESYTNYSKIETIAHKLNLIYSASQETIKIKEKEVLIKEITKELETDTGDRKATLDKYIRKEIEMERDSRVKEQREREFGFQDNEGLFGSQLKDIEHAQPASSPKTRIPKSSKLQPLKEEASTEDQSGKVSSSPFPSESLPASPEVIGVPAQKSEYENIKLKLNKLLDFAKLHIKKNDSSLPDILNSFNKLDNDKFLTPQAFYVAAYDFVEAISDKIGNTALVKELKTLLRPGEIGKDSGEIGEDFWEDEDF